MDGFPCSIPFRRRWRGWNRNFPPRPRGRRPGSVLSSAFVPAALDALKAGDDATHDRLIAEAAAGLSGADAIMLAHFSMSRAAAMARARTDLPVLTSPDAAIAKLKRVLAPENAKGPSAC